MRRITVAVGLALALAIGLLAQGQAAAPSPSERTRAAAAAAPGDEPIFAVPSNDNWSTLTYNHLGDPNKGQVVIDQEDGPSVVGFGWGLVADHTVRR